MAGLQDALSLPRLVLASHKSFYRVLEVTKTHAAKAEKHPDLIRQGGILSCVVVLQLTLDYPDLD